ncbi:MAG: formyl transferase domain protein [Chitinophagaceae bacterium]|nr:formyl transferase domain protein [Chitinophagaceae bacterium]
MKNKVLFVGVDCNTSRMMFHALKDHWQIQQVIFEQPVSTSAKIKFRLKKLGLVSVIGQLLFKVFSDVLIVPFSQKRRHQILADHKLSVQAIPSSIKIELNDVHEADWKNLLALHRPDFILINGTRILKKSLLDQFTMPVINIHAGITPMYRGVHGGYRALMNNDALNFGATIHLVDPGVDTGQILQHVPAKPAAEDNFYTYPLLQFAEAINVLPVVVDRYIATGKLSEISVEKPAFSKLWFYPTIFEYIYYRITKGIK